MLRLRLMIVSIGLLALIVGLSACSRGDGRVNDEEDADYQRGVDLVNSQDFAGAVKEFERALENNPRSAAAHLQLGWLYDTKVNDSAAAIYHYQRHLQLMPNSDRAHAVRERIRLCKQELAGEEFALPGTRNLQREVDRLTAENAALKQQLAVLRHSGPGREGLVKSKNPPMILAANISPLGRPAPAWHSRLHVVRERETITSIAAQYSLKPGAILAANPRLNPRHLRIGQSLYLP